MVHPRRIAALAALLALAAGAPARAQAPAQATAPAPAPTPAPAPAQEAQAPAAPAAPAAQAEAPKPAASAVSRFSLRLATGLGVARGAGNVSIGAGFAVAPRFLVGLEAEYNPWFDYLGGKATPGSFNAYATAAFRWYGSERFEVHTGIFLGMSVLLFNTPGAPGGAVGIILGTNVLRATAKISDRLAFEISPDAVLVVPSLRGVPLVYPQFRLTGALRFSL